MEMVSKFYYKTNKSELLDYVKKGIYHPEATYELLRYIEDYEKNNGVLVGDFHIHVCSSYVRSLLSMIDNPIKQEQVINAYLHALIYEKDSIAERLIPFMFLKEMDQSNLKFDLFNYVLSNNSDLEELFDGEKEKLIFDEETHEFVMGYLSECFVNRGKKK